MNYLFQASLEFLNQAIILRLAKLSFKIPLLYVGSPRSSCTIIVLIDATASFNSLFVLGIPIVDPSTIFVVTFLLGVTIFKCFCYAFAYQLPISARCLIIASFVFTCTKHRLVISIWFQSYGFLRLQELFAC